MSQRKWHRNFLMKGFHLVVLLTAGPGIRDTQVILWNTHMVFSLIQVLMANFSCTFCLNPYIVMG